MHTVSAIGLPGFRRNAHPVDSQPPGRKHPVPDPSDAHWLPAVLSNVQDLHFLSAVPAVSSDRVLPVFRSFGSRILRTDRFLPGRLQTDWCSDSSLKSNHYSSKYFLDRRSTLQRIMERAPAFSS